MLQVDDIIEWDVRNWAQLIGCWSDIIEEYPKTAKVLTVGERNGGLSLWLAQMGYNVVCTDITETTEGAKALHKKYGVADKISYRKLDVVNDETDELYDIILAKSVIGGLKANRQDATTRSFSVQKKAIAQIHSMLDKGGVFLSAENLQGNLFTKWSRTIAKKNKGWRYLKYSELSQLFSSYNILQIKTFGILPSSFSSSVINGIAYGINRVLNFLPANMKYIAFVAAKKD